MINILLSLLLFWCFYRRLSDNSLSGAIPSELGQLSSLTWMFVVYFDSDTNYSILNWYLIIHSLFWWMINIPLSLLLFWYFYRLLSDNSLNGSIPSELGQLSSLTRMFVVYFDSDTNYSILNWYLIIHSLFWWMINIPLSLLLFWCFYRLLYNNSLSGSIPTELAQLLSTTEV